MRQNKKSYRCESYEGIGPGRKFPKREEVEVSSANRTLQIFRCGPESVAGYRKCSSVCLRGW